MKVMNAIMMIVSTSVGMGILGLPIVTAEGGFWPTLCLFFMAWIFMTVAAFYILDVKMHVQGYASLARLIKITLGKPGHWFASITILLLLYALLSTYLMAAVAWIQLLWPALSHYHEVSISIGFSLFFVLLMVTRESRLYHVNNILGIVVLLAFIVMVGANFLPAEPDFLSHHHFLSILPSLPLLLTTFGFSIVVPAIAEYLQYNTSQIQRSILWGSFISLMAYVTWEWVTLGHIPLQGPQSLSALRHSGDNGTGVVVMLAALSHHAYVIFFGKIFAFLLLVTSFLGISLALLHFLGDALHVSVVGRNRLFLSLGMYILPVMVVNQFPSAFVQFLSLAGIFVAILLGLFPVWMVMRLKHQNMLKVERWIHQKWLMIAVNLFFVWVIFQELWNIVKAF